METHIAGFHALAGIPVIEAHRLLKNSATTRRYLLVTEAAEQLLDGLPNWRREQLRETIDDGSTINAGVYSFDLADLPSMASSDQFPRTVKRACDLCRKVGHGLKGFGAE